jgi:DNA-binding Lrp family transcriptional regulator
MRSTTIEPVGPGHHDVEDTQIEMVGGVAQEPPGLLAIGGQGHRVAAGRFEDAAEQFPGDLIVVGYKYVHGWDQLLIGLEWQYRLEGVPPTVPVGKRAVIEVRITPERGGGFNRLAERISRFDEVESCYLMSGGYDLLVFVNGASLQKVAAFVSEKLSTIEGVLSTATHFMLRSYKEHGFLLERQSRGNERLKVAP